MENLDVFESVFKRALREPYLYDRPELSRVAVITDLDSGSLPDYENKVKTFINTCTGRSDFEWTSFHKDQYSHWQDLRSKLDNFNPNLVISYRLLHEYHESLKFSLGALIDTLTQASPWPVLLMPEPTTDAFDRALSQTASVIVVTDHLNGDHRLINYGAAFTHDGSTLTFTHLEAKSTFEYYMQAIERIPEINSEVARETIAEQLLEQPNQYIATVKAVLRNTLPGLQLKRHVEIGNVIDSYRQLILDSGAGLMVCNSKDDSKLAMHSLGHSLSVEFKETPLLLI